MSDLAGGWSELEFEVETGKVQLAQEESELGAPLSLLLPSSLKG